MLELSARTTTRDQLRYSLAGMLGSCVHVWACCHQDYCYYQVQCFVVFFSSKSYRWLLLSVENFRSCGGAHMAVVAVAEEPPRKSSNLWSPVNIKRLVYHVPVVRLHTKLCDGCQAHADLDVFFCSLFLHSFFALWKCKKQSPTGFHVRKVLDLILDWLYMKFFYLLKLHRQSNIHLSLYAHTGVFF